MRACPPAYSTRPGLVPGLNPPRARRSFFANYGECNNKECTFLHIRRADKVRLPPARPRAVRAHRILLPQVASCPWYDRGLCKHGPRCRYRHTQKKPCVAYLQGFCPDGPACEFGHPKFELPAVDGAPSRLPASVARMGLGMNVTCFHCGQFGHYAARCPNRQVQNQQEMLLDSIAPPGMVPARGAATASFY